ncbi:MAG: hypothetical protein IPG26_05810 [Coprothermobacter sp.]|nr:hypothetical protein [Coprothermobacter sp.]
MYELVDKELVAPDIWKIKVRAPHIAKAYKPGNFCYRVYPTSAGNAYL